MSPSNNMIVKDPDILGGTPVFRGTRVRVQALFDSLESGETLEGFLEGFPSLTREDGNYCSRTGQRVPV